MHDFLGLHGSYDSLLLAEKKGYFIYLFLKLECGKSKRNIKQQEKE
jgi:hypothetical protein